MDLDGLLDDGRFMCPHCGALLDAFGDHVQQLRDDIANLERELRTKRSKIRSLQRDQFSALHLSPHYEPAARVLQYWKDVCSPQAKELGGKRLELCIARLEGGYNEEDLIEAVDGYGKFPYVVDGRRKAHGQASQRYVDAELIFRDAKHVDAGRALAEQDESYKTMLTGTGPSSVSPPALSELGAAALRYAQNGRQVFPCKRNMKQPMTRNGLLDATSDPERIIRFWQKNPDANVAIRTGSESGLVILDVDGEEGIESLRRLEKIHGALPTTASIVTPRGGQHYYFRHPGKEIRNTTGVPGPGLDIRGDGGYVLASPSQVDGRKYEIDDHVGIVDLPKWLSEGLQQYQRRSGTKVDPSVWEKMVTKGVREGSRNDQLTRLAGFLLNRFRDPAEHGFVLGILKITNRERCQPPLPDREVEQILEHILRARQREKD